MLVQALAERRVFGAGGFVPGHHDDVDGRETAMRLAKAFTDLPLDPVPADGGRRHLAGDSEAKPGIVQAVWRGKQREKVVRRTNAFAENTSKGFRFQQSQLAGKPEVLNRLRRVVYGQRRARPFARRALNTLRPPLVAMRARKPWVRLRRRLLGW